MRCWILGIAALLPFSPLRAENDRHVVLVCIDGFAAYHLDNPSLLLPNIRKLAAEGARANSSETIYPSVTHPAHTTLITGVEPREHGVIYNTLTNRETGAVYHASSLPRPKAILAPTLFDEAKKKGMTTAAFHWPQVADDPAVDHNFATRYLLHPERLDPTALKPAFAAELREAGIAVDAYFRWRKDGNLRASVDTVLVDAACHVIRKHRPHFLAIHISNTDTTQHAHGPESPLSQAALALADHHVGMLVRAIADAGLSEKTLFVLSADHGFATVHQELNLHAVFAEAGLEEKLSFHPSGWSLFVRRRPSFDATTDQPKLDAALQRLRTMPEVDRVLASDEFPTLGYPKFEENVHVQGEYLVIAKIESYPVVDVTRAQPIVRKKARPAHSHGFLPTHPKMFSMLILSGAGIKAGTNLGHTRNLDVAPTIARYLGFDLPKAAGQPLATTLR